MRKTIIVALARKLLIALWRYTTAGVVIEGAAASQRVFRASATRALPAPDRLAIAWALSFSPRARPTRYSGASHRLRWRKPPGYSARSTAPSASQPAAAITRCPHQQMAEIAVSRQMFGEILMLIARLRAPPAPAREGRGQLCDRRRRRRCALMQAKQRVSPPRRNQLTCSTVYYARDARCTTHAMRDLPLPKPPEWAIVAPQPAGIRGMSAQMDAFWTTVATMPRRCVTKVAARARNHEFRKSTLTATSKGVRSCPTIGVRVRTL